MQSVKEIITTITQRGQVTVPAEVRRALGVKPRDKIAFRLEDGAVRLSAVTFTLESAYGSVEPSERPEDFEVVSRAAKDIKAERTVEEMRTS